jgi:hypothetical protein
MELTDSLKILFMETAQSLKGSARRLFMARTLKELGPGGQRCAERELGWNRGTLRKGTHELQSGFTCLDAFSARGRKRAEDHLPNLLPDIQAIVDRQSQVDPQFRTTRLYTRLSAAEVRRQLIARADRKFKRHFRAAPASAPHPAAAPSCPQRTAATCQRGPQHGGARLWRVLDRRRRMR